jgi:preprotein translocase subunit YajC
MFITPAHAQAAGAASQSGAFASFASLAPFFLVMVAFYFLLIRPQQRRQKELQQSIEAVKKGDQVVTAGGILGRVTKVEAEQVEVEIAANVRVRVVKSTLTAVTNAAKPAND